MGIELLTLEAPAEQATEEELEDWIERGVPFFDPRIYSAWQLYSKPLTDGIEFLENPYDAKLARTKFAHSPHYLALDQETENITANLWIDDINKTNQKRANIADIHVRGYNGFRRHAYPLMKNFLDTRPPEYKMIQCAWDFRNPKDDPSKFFRHFGFKIENRYGYTIATKEIE